MSLFLSTLSLRRATNNRKMIVSQVRDFYPRSPCGERLNELLEQSASYNISIHALLAESDNQHEIDQKSSSISIHALLAESDNDSRGIYS